jgi:hypothetical protein
VRNKVLACDLDGIIFNFNKPYTDWLNAKFKVSIPPDDHNYPNTWNYAIDGNFVTKDQEREFWKWAGGVGNYSFWRFLPVYPGAHNFLAAAQAMFDEVVFITSRPGTEVKRATVDALEILGVKNPNVIISSYKVPDLINCGATDFIDDRDKNFEDILAWGLGQEDDTTDVRAKLWMLDRPWNRHFNHPCVTRISDPMEILL